MSNLRNARTTSIKRSAAGIRVARLVLLAILAGGTLAPAQVNSDLWGTSGELWDPVNSPLGDFTNVGYLGGAVAIADEDDWPVGVDVTNFGAIPNDGMDDSQSFIDAIAACPNNHAVYVPIGRYTIMQQIVPDRDYFVLRGEDMYQTVLHFPKYLNAIYIQEVGYRNPAYDDGSNGHTHRGPEWILSCDGWNLQEHRKPDIRVP